MHIADQKPSLFMQRTWSSVACQLLPEPAGMKRLILDAIDGVVSGRDGLCLLTVFLLHGNSAPPGSDEVCYCASSHGSR